MNPMDLVAWLRSDGGLHRINVLIADLMSDHAHRFGRLAGYDRVYAWMFARLLEEARSMPPSRGRDWILGDWQARTWPRLRDALTSGTLPLEWRPLRYLAWQLAAEIEGVCHPRVTPEGLLTWLRSEGGDVELHHAWARCAESDPEFIEAFWIEETERRLVREVFLARLAQNVLCLSWIYADVCRRWLDFLRAESTVAEALKIAQMPLDEPFVLVRYRIPTMATWIADQLEALIETPKESGAVAAEQGGPSAADGTDVG